MVDCCLFVFLETTLGGGGGLISLRLNMNHNGHIVPEVTIEMIAKLFI